MTAQYSQWFTRGRAHQAEQRPVDAMLCFRRAARADPSQSEVHLHLGEVLWQLRQLPDALAEWREAVRSNVGSLPAHLALAEGTLATGDFEQAEQVADQALARFPGIAPLLFIRGTSRLAVPQERTPSESESAARDVVDALALHRDLLTVPSLAGPLANALDRGRAATNATALIDAMAALLVEHADIVSGSPAALLAVVAERLADRASGSTSADALLQRALQREYGAGDHDALRRLALVAHARQHMSFAVLTQRYAEVCTLAFASSLPLMWPRRTHGPFRVIVLVENATAHAVVQEIMGRISSATIARCEIVVILMPRVDEPVAAPKLDAPQLARVLQLPAVVDANEARRLALLDADVLLDACGLAAAVGPLLAARPARRVIALARRGVANVAPLVDGTWTLDRLDRDLVASIDAMPPAGESTASAMELASMLSEAARLHQHAQVDAAQSQYDRVLALQPQHAPVLHLRGALRRDSGDLDGALADFMGAVEVAPRFLDARIAAAQAALDLGRPQDAIEIARGHLADASGFKALWVVLALAHLALGEAAVAAEVLEHATRLDLADGETHYNHGVALQTLRRFDDAARAYQRALAFRPDLSAADFNLGVLFQEQKQNEAAIAAYSQVLRDDPAHVMAYKNLGEVLFAAGRLDAWRANFARFEANCPLALALAVQALEVCQHFGEFERVEQYLDGLRNERYTTDNPVELVQCLEELLYLLLFFDVEPDIVYRFSQTYDATARLVYGTPMALPERRRDGKIRVGYLSADLRNHVMGKMVWEAVHRHDRAEFELFFYSLSTQEDEWTARYRGLGDHYTVVAHLPEKHAAATIARDDLDLLIDLSTHTRGAKPGILALKPARVQITHVASAGAVGLSSIDFKLTDEYADVPANQEHTIERLLPMQGCVYPYRHIAPAPSAVPTRARLGLDAEAFVIGAFVTPLKLSRRCLRLWREVLERVPRARLAISPNTPALRASFVHLAASAGIPRDRVVVVPQGRDEHENQARYAVIDLVLDPMPFGGVNGTLEALDTGVPVVTLCGRRHGERTSYSILANLGVTDTVAMTGPEYVDIAVRLATDAAFMQSVRAKIRAGIVHSPLTDMAAHTRHLEAAYRAALRVETSQVFAGTAA